jgi:hypothetical protein
MVQVQDLKIFF